MSRALCWVFVRGERCQVTSHYQHYISHSAIMFGPATINFDRARLAVGDGGGWGRPVDVIRLAHATLVIKSVSILLR